MVVIDGVMFRTRAGCPWRDLLGGYGESGDLADSSWKGVFTSW